MSRQTEETCSVCRGVVYKNQPFVARHGSGGTGKIRHHREEDCGLNERTEIRIVCNLNITLNIFDPEGGGPREIPDVVKDLARVLADQTGRPIEVIVTEEHGYSLGAWRASPANHKPQKREEDTGSSPVGPSQV